MTELDSPETHIYISTRGYRECENKAYVDILHTQKKKRNAPSDAR